MYVNRQFTEEQIQMAINMQRSTLQVVGKWKVKSYSDCFIPSD